METRNEKKGKTRGSRAGSRKETTMVPMGRKRWVGVSEAERKKIACEAPDQTRKDLCIPAKDGKTSLVSMVKERKSGQGRKREKKSESSGKEVQLNVISYSIKGDEAHKRQGGEFSGG